MALARLLAFVSAFAVTAALPASAAAKLEFNLPAQIFKVFDESGKSDADPERCQAIVFVEFPKIKHAVSYRIIVRRTDLNTLEDYVAPPFDDSGRGFITRFPPPTGFARFFVGAYSTPDGCSAADAETDVAKITSAKVSLDRKFQKRFKKAEKPPLKCAYKPGERTVDLGPRGGRKIIVRRKGTVTTTEKGTRQPTNLATNRYAVSGTIVKTGPGSIVRIAALNGSGVLVGPNTTLRITDAGLEVLEAPRHFKPWNLPQPGQDYKVRTCNMVLSARG